MTMRDMAARVPLTAEEIARRANALAGSDVPAPVQSPALLAPAIKPVELSLIETWQMELAREAAAGRGIDALPRILAAIKGHYAADKDESGLFDAIQQMSECAHRHLGEYDITTIETIFDGVFPPNNNANNALDAVALNQDAEAEITRAARLPLVQYERERKAIAERLGMRPSALDAATKGAQPQDTKGQGRAFELKTVKPWGEPVNGAKLLDEICEAIERYIVLPPGGASMLALWALHTHCFDCFGHSPRAAITSPEKGCGKTTTLDILSCLVARPLPTSNATVSAIFRIVELATPTLLIDEADTFLKENDELRGILNTGHRRGGQVTRTVGDDHEPRLFSTWAPAAIAMIGRLPDTLNDRSVIISLRRRKPSERVECFRSDRADQLEILQQKMARWTQDHRPQLTASDPSMGALVNRVADNWRPLFAIADAAGGEWPSRAREVASAAVSAMMEESINVQLLGDVRRIFDGGPDQEQPKVPLDRIASAELVERLTSIEGRPWAEWKAGKPLTQNTLARLLSRFEILSGTIRLLNGQTAKGYYRASFVDVFERYLGPQTVTASQVNNGGHCDGLQSVTSRAAVTFQKASQLNNDGDCDGVTLLKDQHEAIDL